jgi:hypothetical protein
MMGPQALERIDDKLAAFDAALATSLPAGRIIEPGFTPYSERDAAQLLAGVLNRVCEGEGSYSNARGMAAKEGTLRVILICHLQVAEGSSSDQLQQAEITLMEELKTFTRTGLTGADLVLTDLQQSRLLEHPYGWVIAFFEIRPPGAHTH